MRAMEQDDDEQEWRQHDEDEASSAVGCPSPIPLFALSLLQSFPPHDSLFSIPASASASAASAGAARSIGAPGGSAPVPPAAAGVSSSSAVDMSVKPLIGLEPCAKNQENEHKSKGGAGGGGGGGGGGGAIDQNGGGGGGGGGKKIRSKNWTRTEMLKLIGLRADLEPRFSGGGKKMELWEEIADALNREGIVRDGQQCRDKWEKLCSGYKDVRDSIKPKEDFMLYDVLHPILSGRLSRNPAASAAAGSGSRIVDDQLQFDHHHVGQEQSFANQEETINLYEDEVLDGSAGNVGGGDQGGGGGGGSGGFGSGGAGGSARARKKRKMIKYVPVADVAVVQSLVETVVAKQQRFFRELLESMERREHLRDQMRQEREEQWRAEDRAQRAAFNNAMVFLAQKLAEDRSGQSLQQQQQQQQKVSILQQQAKAEGGGAKKRSKNWKRAEVLQLIKLRGEMDAQFSSGTRRAAVWEELSEALMAQGIPRDGKQCREKWDKLTAAYKDVSDGMKERVDVPYYVELSVALKKPAAAVNAPSLAVAAAAGLGILTEVVHAAS